MIVKALFGGNCGPLKKLKAAMVKSVDRLGLTSWGFQD
jgi:hypothetical protein